MLLPRIVAGAAPREALEPGSSAGASGKTGTAEGSVLHYRFLEWLRETYAYLRAMRFSSDVFWDNVQVRGGWRVFAGDKFAG